MKHCPGLKEDKHDCGYHPDTSFYKNANSLDGLSFYCRECTKRYMKEWRHKNPQKVYAYSAQRAFEAHTEGTRRPSKSKTGYIGVVDRSYIAMRDYDPEQNVKIEQYEARIKLDGRMRRIGEKYFETPEEAALEYDKEVDRRKLNRKKNFS